MEVIITVPHGPACNDDDLAKVTHLCDLAAYPAALLIQERLSSRGVNSFVLPADVNRRVVDLNRSPSRSSSKTGFRRKLRELLKTNMGTVKLVLDVHSFPAHYDQWTGHDIVLLEDRQNMEGLPVASLRDYLISTRVNASLFRGEHNDIQDEMHELGYESFLVEFNEDLLNEDASGLMNATSDVSDWVYNFVAKHKPPQPVK